MTDGTDDEAVAKAKAQTAAADAAKATSEAAKAATQARIAEVELRQKLISAAIPEIGEIDRGKLTVSGTEAVHGSALAHRALAEAAEVVVKAVVEAISDRGKGVPLLVTNDPDLAAADAVYAQVTDGLAGLLDAAKRLLPDPAADLPEPELAGAAVGALIAAVPPVLSLLSAQRSLSTAALTVDDLPAAATVAGALAQRGARVWHDDFRTLPAGGELRTRLAELRGSRYELLAAKRAGTPPADEIDSLVTAIDEFVTAVTTVASGAKRSLLTTAVLREALHGTVTHALLVKGAGGTSTQVVDDRPLMFRDRVSVVATVSVTYLLIKVDDGSVVCAGTASGRAQLAGEIGERIDFR